MALIFLLLYNRVQIVYCVVSIEKAKTSRILLNNEDGLTFLYLSKIGIGDGQNLYNLDPEIARLFFLKSFNLNIPAFSWMIAYVVLYVYNMIIKLNQYLNGIHHVNGDGGVQNAQYYCYCVRVKHEAKCFRTTT